jgi:peptidoglycan/LPS O-acetylase OafA/YrhL
MIHHKQLDGLRAVAVFLVLIVHFAVPVSNLIDAGYYGVDLFFVISGYLITTILVRSNEPFGKSYRKFLGRRTLRIFPIYYLTIFILFIARNEYVCKYLAYCLTYTYNYAMVIYHIQGSLINHFWSLCLEEQFYLFWPFIVLGMKSSIRNLKIVIFLLVLFCYVQVFFSIIPALTPYNYVGLIPQAHSLGIGALGALFSLENKIPKKLLEDKWLEWLALFALLFFLVSGFTLKVLFCPLLSLFFVLKTTHKGFAIKGIDKFLSKDSIVYLGSISYGIYLYHLPLGYYLTEYVFNPFFWKKINFDTWGRLSKLQWNSWILKWPFYSVLSIGLAHISYKYFEKPILSLKDKWFKYDR